MTYEHRRMKTQDLREFPWFGPYLDPKRRFFALLDPGWTLLFHSWVIPVLLRAYARGRFRLSENLSEQFVA